MKILMISNHLGVQSGVQRYVQNLLLPSNAAKCVTALSVGARRTRPAQPRRSGFPGVRSCLRTSKKDRIAPWPPTCLRTHGDYDIIHYHGQQDQCPGLRAASPYASAPQAKSWCTATSSTRL